MSSVGDAIGACFGVCCLGFANWFGLGAYRGRGGRNICGCCSCCNDDPLEGWEKDEAKLRTESDIQPRATMSMEVLSPTFVHPEEMPLRGPDSRDA
ncbi:hypothetical protein MVEN_02175900 [Mycena venus]|uniref:Uncharacterized protein n=1 Tax=Mycena venus TaxID=2733690 RepID=A0A8H6X8Y6_9AGAR|nr:hypothetical protein MVEN_02175900 [Mycena venus]